MIFLRYFLVIFFGFTCLSLASIEDDIRYLIDIGDLNKSLELTKKLSSKSKDDLALKDFLIGSIYFKLGKYQKAEDFFISASSGSMNEEYYASLAKNFLFLGKINKAKSMAETTLKFDQDSMEALYVIAKAELIVGNTEKAIDVFTEQEQLKNNNEDFNIYLAKKLKSLNFFIETLYI